jgi:hypothetical protein
MMLASALPVAAWTPAELVAPCQGDCAVAIYGGFYVEDSMGELFFSSPTIPSNWDLTSDDRLVAMALSRRAGWFWRDHFSLEPEIGLGQRSGRQEATEVWAALFLRYHGFPWDRWLVTTVAASTGLNWASEVTDVEQERAHDGEGSQVMHFLAPEITLALPSRPNLEFMIRFHHRSGVFGLVSDAWGGAQYATVGLRVRF